MLFVEEIKVRISKYLTLSFFNEALNLRRIKTKRFLRKKL